MTSADNELYRALGTLEQAVKDLTTEIHTMSGHNVILSNRVGVLETWRVYLVAFSAGVTVTLGILATTLVKLLTILK